jgi:hypothetical protein
MKTRFGILGAIAVSVCGATEASRADTIFDVEHARANYRAGLTSSYDAELLARWGAPSGNYPAISVVPSHRRLAVKKRSRNVAR